MCMHSMFTVLNRPQRFAHEWRAAFTCMSERTECTEFPIAKCKSKQRVRRSECSIEFPFTMSWISTTGRQVFVNNCVLEKNPFSKLTTLRVN